MTQRLDLPDEMLDQSDGPTKMLLAAEHWKARYLATLADKKYAIRMFDQKEAACLQALARIALLERLLADAHVTLNHASIFISTREKMHKTGQELYGKLSADIAAALKGGEV